MVLSPSPAADDRSLGLGIEPERVGRWVRGVDLDALRPGAASDPDGSPGEVKVLYAGRLTHEKGVDLLADELPRARTSATRGSTCCSPAAAPRSRCCGSVSATRATFLGWLDREQLAHGLRQRRRLPLLLAHRHVRPGDRRGAGERPAGGRGRRGRPRLADPRPPHGLALRARPRASSRRRSPSSPPHRSCASGSRTRRSARSAAAPGRRRWPSLPRDMSASARAGRRKPRARAGCAKLRDARCGASLSSDPVEPS